MDHGLRGRRRQGLGWGTRLSNLGGSVRKPTVMAVTAV